MFLFVFDLFALEGIREFFDVTDSTSELSNMLLLGRKKSYLFGLLSYVAGFC